MVTVYGLLLTIYIYFHKWYLQRYCGGYFQTWNLFCCDKNLNLASWNVMPLFYSSSSEWICHFSRYYKWKLQVTIFWYVISQGAGLKEGSITRDYSLMPDTKALSLDNVTMGWYRKHRKRSPRLSAEVLVGSGCPEAIYFKETI